MPLGRVGDKHRPQPAEEGVQYLKSPSPFFRQSPCYDQAWYRSTDHHTRDTSAQVYIHLQSHPPTHTTASATSWPLGSGSGMALAEETIDSTNCDAFNDTIDVRETNKSITQSLRDYNSSILHAVHMNIVNKMLVHMTMTVMTLKADIIPHHFKFSLFRN